MISPISTQNSLLMFIKGMGTRISWNSLKEVRFSVLPVRKTEMIPLVEPLIKKSIIIESQNPISGLKGR